MLLPAMIVVPVSPDSTDSSQLDQCEAAEAAERSTKGQLAMVQTKHQQELKATGLHGTIDFTVIGTSFEPRSPRNSVGGRLVRVADCLIRDTASKRPMRPECPESGASEPSNPQFFSWRLRRTCCEPHASPSVGA